MALEGRPARCSRSASNFWHCIWLQFCLWLSQTLTFPSVWCPASPHDVYFTAMWTRCFVYTWAAWLGWGMHTDEHMFNCWKNKKKCFFPPLLELYLPFGLLWSLRMMAEFLPWHFFSKSGCQVLLTTVEAPSVYTIPPKSLELQDFMSMLFPWDHIAFGVWLGGLWPLRWDFDRTLHLISALKVFKSFLSLTGARTNI